LEFREAVAGSELTSALLNTMMPITIKAAPKNHCKVGFSKQIPSSLRVLKP